VRAAPRSIIQALELGSLGVSEETVPPTKAIKPGPVVAISADRLR
jgi:hypothetical protein